MGDLRGLVRWCLRAAQVGSAHCRAAPCGAGLCRKMCPIHPSIHPCPGCWHRDLSRAGVSPRGCAMMGVLRGGSRQRRTGRGEQRTTGRLQVSGCHHPHPSQPWDLPAQAIRSSALSKPEVSLWEQERLVLCLLYPGFLRSQQLSFPEPSF